MNSSPLRAFFNRIYYYLLRIRYGSWKKIFERRAHLFYDYLTGASGNYWTRFVMDLETKKLVGRLPYEKMRALEISGDQWSNYPFQSYQSLTFPDFDICQNDIQVEADIILAEQVFEHLKYPYKAGMNVFNGLRPGGYFLLTVPFMIRYHPHPVDCARWSEEGLKYFLVECGFLEESIQTGSWGNRQCVKGNFEDWVEYRKRLHSLENDSAFPVMVWALAKR